MGLLWRRVTVVVLKGIYTRWIHRQRKIIVNKKSDKTYYVIRRWMQAGFFSNFFYVLGHIMYAQKHNWIPVVDMKNYLTLYSEQDKILGTDNAWEYYFENLCDLTLEEIYANHNYILSDGEYKYDYAPSYELGRENDFIVSKLTDYNAIVKKYIHIKPNILEDVSDFFSQIECKNLLGVHYRGTDMNNCKGHPKAIPENRYIEKIALLYGKTIDGIFICSDEIGIVEYLKENYGKVYSTNAYRAEGDNKYGLHNERDAGQIRKNHKYMLGKEVLIDTLILSKCNYLLCAPSNVAYAAIVFNNNQYEDIFMMNNSED